MKTFRFFSLAAVLACLTTPVLAACGGTSPAAQSTPSPALACTTGGPASASWTSPDQMTGTAPPIVSAVVSGDTLTLTFAKGTPAFELTPQPNTQFTAVSGRGETVVLSGAAGVRIILRGFRGDMQNYSGNKAFTTNGKTLVEVREIGDYEGVVGWAAGMAKPGCANVAAGSSTLTFTFVAS